MLNKKNAIGLLRFSIVATLYNPVISSIGLSIFCKSLFVTVSGASISLFRLVKETNPLLPQKSGAQEYCRSLFCLQYFQESIMILK